MTNIKLGRRALRALGGRRFRGMTVADGDTPRLRWTLAVDGPAPCDRLWCDGSGCWTRWEADADPLLDTALDVGWLILDEAALGALLAVANEMPRPMSGSTGEDATTALVAYCHGRGSCTNACKRLVAAIEAAREGGR